MGRDDFRRGRKEEEEEMEEKEEHAFRDTAKQVYYCRMRIRFCPPSPPPQKKKFRRCIKYIISVFTFSVLASAC